MKLLLSVGHGGGDGGAVYNGTNENIECSRVAELAKRLIEPYISTAIVPDVRLPGRIKWINAQGAEIVIELHLDSMPGATGCSIFYVDGSPARVPAEQLINSYAKEIGLKNRGAKPDTSTRHGRLGIVRDTRPMAFLIELGFIQGDLLTVRAKGAIALAKAVLDFYKIPMQNLQEWEKIALEWAKETIGFKQENPHNPMTRVEVAEALRKFFIFLKNEVWKQ